MNEVILENSVTYFCGAVAVDTKAALDFFAQKEKAEPSESEPTKYYPVVINENSGDSPIGLLDRYIRQGIATKDLEAIRSELCKKIEIEPFSEVGVWLETKMSKVSEIDAQSWQSVAKNMKSIQTICDAETREEMQTLLCDGFIDTFGRKHNRKGIYKYINHYRVPFDREIAIDSTTRIHLRYIDYYIYPSDIILFVMKIDNSGTEYGKLSSRNFAIKMVNFYSKDGYSMEYLDLFAPLFDLLHKEWWKSDVKRAFHQLFIGNKLYMYQIVQLPESVKCDDMVHRLYELTNMVDSGVMSDPNDEFYPNPVYYQKLIENNTIALYNNWMAMALPDAFCVLMKHTKDAFISEPWENSRFKLFLNTILLKNYLIICNATYQKKSINGDFEHDFIDFDRAFNLRMVSYNNVPQTIYNKMRYALEIDDELALINTKITHYREKQDNQSDRRRNIVLFFVALLAVTSAFADGVTLFTQLGFIADNPSKVVLHSIRITCLTIFSLIVIVGVIICFKYKKHKK